MRCDAGVDVPYGEACPECGATDDQNCPGLPVDREYQIRMERIEEAAEALINNVKARYPGKDFRCPYMRELNDAVLAYKHFQFGP